MILTIIFIKNLLFYLKLQNIFIHKKIVAKNIIQKII